jgi:Zn-dependent protease
MTRPPGTTPPGSGPGATRSPAGPRIAGIAVRLTGGAYLLSMLIVLVSALTLPRAVPGWPALAYLAATAGLVLGFLAHLAGHELAHAMVARRYGADTREIRIGLAGSTSHGRHDFTTPRAAWRVAAAGPAASLVLTAITAAAMAGLAAAGAGRLAVLALAVLTWMGAALTVISALPAAGLDGGRVAHALAWRRSGDRARAAVTAGRIGQFTGALLIAGGITLLVLGNLGGIPLGLIGLMMASASRAQAREVLAITALAGLRVQDLLDQDRPVTTAPSWQTVQAFLDGEFAGTPEGTGRGLTHGGAVAFPLRDFDGSAAGVVTLTQLAAVAPERRGTVRLCDVGTPVRDLVTTTPGEQLSRLLARLSVAPRTPAALHTSGHALVLDESGRAAGVLTPADFSRASQLGALQPHRTSP